MMIAAVMGMTSLQQKKLTAEELRVALGSRGLSTEGNRYKLVERLTQAVAVSSGVTSCILLPWINTAAVTWTTQHCW